MPRSLSAAPARCMWIWNDSSADGPLFQPEKVLSFGAQFVRASQIPRGVDAGFSEVISWCWTANMDGAKKGKRSAQRLHGFVRTL